MGINYKDSGVDIDAGNNFVKKIKPYVKSTFSERVINDIGGFGALFSGSFPELEDPILVSGTDGVGTKIKIAQKMEKHDTIGIDAVAMCVNDILTSGARPLFFLDYISCGKLKENVMVDVVKGIADGCSQAGCSLIGGETAEHPNVMPADDYDVAGFSVGVVDRKKIINGENIKPGDAVIGVASSGIHSNGYSLVRKLFFEIKKYTVDTQIAELGKTLGEELLTPTRIYCKQIQSVIDAGLELKGLVHVTGGGFYENIPRILPAGCGVKINKNAYVLPSIFDLIAKEGDVSEREMYTTFNMGVGLIIVADKNDTDKIITRLQSHGENSFLLGEVTLSEAKLIEII